MTSKILRQFHKITNLDYVNLNALKYHVRRGVIDAIIGNIENNKHMITNTETQPDSVLNKELHKMASEYSLECISG